MEHEAAQRGDEPAAAAARDALAAAASAYVTGPAVRDDDQVAAGGHARTLSPARGSMQPRPW